MDVLRQIRQSIRKHDLIPRGETVVAGVSGGPDSLCLLHALRALRDEYSFSLHVAHLNHQLRGADADADAQFVQDLAAQWGLPATIGARDVAALAREHKLSIEEAARQARYTFLAEVAAEQNSETIAVAHNADDQAESVLMHFLRGSGTSGLRGMLMKSHLADFRLPAAAGQSPIRNPHLNLIRPLLNVPRAEVERYCREHDLRPRFDRSNLDTTFFRNRLRHELLPQLETYNPNIREVLRRTGDVIAAEVEVLNEISRQAWQEVRIAESAQAVTLSLAAWRRLPLALQRATVREAVRRLRPSLRNIDFIHIDDAVSHLQAAETGARVTLPQGLMLHVDYQSFTITGAGAKLAPPDWPLLWDARSLPVSLPGATPLPSCDWVLEADYLDARPEDVFRNADPWAAYLDAGRAGSELAARTRRAGDVFHPQGMPSPLHLADWMTNVKIPRRVRDHLPLIVARDQITWVAGYRVGQPFLVTQNTKRILKLSFRR